MNQKNPLGLNSCFLDKDDPIELFKIWMEKAKVTELNDPNALALATADKNSIPSVRIVLLKDFSKDGFVFYTNYGSRKSHELRENDKVALLFHWNVLQRQIRIEGTVEKVSKQQSADYFHSRDRGSQVGAWASKQSQKLKYDNELKERMAHYSKEYAQGEVPHPEFWGGWRVKPTYIEFWQGRASRLHDRVCFEKQDGDWTNFKLHP